MENHFSKNIYLPVYLLENHNNDYNEIEDEDHNTDNCNRSKYLIFYLFIVQTIFLKKQLFLLL